MIQVPTNPDYKCDLICLHHVYRKHKQLLSKKRLIKKHLFGAFCYINKIFRQCISISDCCFISVRFVQRRNGLFQQPIRKYVKQFPLSAVFQPNVNTCRAIKSADFPASRAENKSYRFNPECSQGGQDHVHRLPVNAGNTRAPEVQCAPEIGRSLCFQFKMVSSLRIVLTSRSTSMGLYRFRVCYRVKDLGEEFMKQSVCNRNQGQMNFCACATRSKCYATSTFPDKN